MSKVFEDYFSELQTNMVSICLEYVENKADIIYIYCSFEEGVILSDFFYCINDKVVRKHKLNDAIKTELGGFRYDTSVMRQKGVMTIINEDIEKLSKMCNLYKKEMPTEIKLVYDVIKNSLKADYRYDLVYSNNPIKTAADIAMEWFEEVKKQNEIVNL